MITPSEARDPNTPRNIPAAGYLVFAGWILCVCIVYAYHMLRSIF